MFIGSECPASQQLYTETNQLVEKFTKIMYIVIVYMTMPCILLPKSIHSFYIYFTTDLGADAFELAFPMWCGLSIYYTSFSLKLLEDFPFFLFQGSHSIVKIPLDISWPQCYKFQGYVWEYFI